MTVLSSARRLSGLALAAAIVLTGCAKNAPQDTFQPKGPNARTIDDLQRPLFYVAGVVGLLVFIAIGYSCHSNPHFAFSVDIFKGKMIV